MQQNWDPYIGPAAGIATSVLWTATSLLFTAAGKRIGPVATNAARIALAIVLLGLTHRAVSGFWVPQVGARQIWFLGLSGILGLSLGDQFLFTAFVRIGPRLSMLIMSTAPLFATLFGWLALAESLGALAWLGMLATIGGVSWVVAERPTDPLERKRAGRAAGMLFAFIGAACQAGGLLLSKQGMGHGWLPDADHLSPQSATFIRMVFAGLGMIPILGLHLLRRRRRLFARGPALPTGAVRMGWVFMAGGAIVGPYLGVWMSLVATDRTPLGTAQTLCSLAPVFILPFSRWVHREALTVRAVCGACIAVAGSALLFVNPR